MDDKELADAVVAQCPSCQGTGMSRDFSYPFCVYCDGSGVVESDEEKGDG